MISLEDTLNVRYERIKIGGTSAVRLQIHPPPAIQLISQPNEETFRQPVSLITSITTLSWLVHSAEESFKDTQDQTGGV